MKIRLFVLFSILCMERGIAQIDITESKVSAWIIAPNYSIQFPLGNMKTDYGWNNNVGINAWRKTEQNWVFGFEGNFLFGSTVNNPYALGYAISSAGTVIGKEGSPIEFNLNERGWMLKAQLGKVFKVFPKSNPNSGVLVMGGIGYLEHKTYIDIDDLNARQFQSDYLTGYDRKTGGILLSGFLGYFYMSNNKFLHLYAGVEPNLGLTKNLRNWDFAENRKIVDARKDFLLGIKFAIMIAIFNKTKKKDVYYYQ